PGPQSGARQPGRTARVPGGGPAHAGGLRLQRRAPGDRPRQRAAVALPHPVLREPGYFRPPPGTARPAARRRAGRRRAGALPGGAPGSAGRRTVAPGPGPGGPHPAPGARARAAADRGRFQRLDQPPGAAVRRAIGAGRGIRRRSTGVGRDLPAAAHRIAPARTPGLAAGPGAAPDARAVHERPCAPDAAAPDVPVRISLAAAGPHLPARLCRAARACAARPALEETVGSRAAGGRTGIALKRGNFPDRDLPKLRYLGISTLPRRVLTSVLS